MSVHFHDPSIDGALNGTSRLKELIFLTIGSIMACVILGAVLYPLFVTPRTRSRHSCLSNLKQLEIGILMYAEDNDERMLPANVWEDVTFPYTKTRQIYTCPDIKGYLLDQKRDANSEISGYAFNSLLTLRPLRDNRDNRDDPALNILIADANIPGPNPNGPGRSILAAQRITVYITTP